jgi:predicted RNA-binding protein with PIN domain
MAWERDSSTGGTLLGAPPSRRKQRGRYVAGRVRWLVDGMNVIGSRPTGWWRDRRGAMRELVRELGDYARATGEGVTVVFDGRPFDLDAGGVEVLFASRSGRDAADDDIAAIASDAPGEVRVVTSDRALAERVRAGGAQVVSAGSFRGRLGRLPGRPG